MKANLRPDNRVTDFTNLSTDQITELQTSPAFPQTRQQGYRLHQPFHRPDNRVTDFTSLSTDQITGLQTSPAFPQTR